MNEKIGKHILIVGNSSVEYTIAKKLSMLDNVEKIYVASGFNSMHDFCTVLDIREDSVQELLEFVLEHDIDLTIASSEKAIKADIATLFQQNNQMIFAPTLESAQICLNKSTGKKFMYKNRIHCPKFGIFDKPSMAVDYIKKSEFPLVIKPEEYQGGQGSLICPNFSIAKNHVETLFDSGEKRVVIENFVFGHEFSFYVITDGYKALPLGAVANYKHALEGNGGAITQGMGAFAPDYKISKQIEKRLLQHVIYPALNSLARCHTPYVGILGVDCILSPDDNFSVIEFKPFLQSPDCEVIMSLIEENIYQLFESCAIGAFADDYEKIGILESYSISCVLSAPKVCDSIIKGLEDLDEETIVSHYNTKKNRYLEYEATGGRTLVLTRVAKTLSRAIENLYEEISCISYDGIKFRKDIGKI